MDVVKGLFKLLIGIILVIATLWVSVTYTGWQSQVKYQSTT